MVAAAAFALLSLGDGIDCSRLCAQHRCTLGAAQLLALQKTLLHALCLHWDVKHTFIAELLGLASVL